MPDFDSTSSLELDDLERSVDSLVSQLDSCGSEIADRFRSRLDEETLASVAPPSAEPAQLGDQVEELISDAIDAVDSLQDEISEPTEVADQDVQAVEDLASQVEEMIADAEDAAIADAADSAPPTDVEAAAGEAPVAESSDESVKAGDADEANGADSAGVVVATFDDATDVIEESAPDTAPAPAPSAEQSETIESLDAAIESEAESIKDELDELDGEFESVDEVAASEAPAAEPTIEAPADDDSLDQAGAETVTQTEAAVAASPAAESITDDNENRTAEGSSESASRLHQLIARVRSLALSLTVSNYEPILRRLLVVLTPMARPLTRLDPKMRDTVGWAALNTVFIAICVWLYLILR